MQNPNAGILIQETGGIRKVRHPLPGKGKSGSIRVFYYDYIAIEHLFLLVVIKKSQRENLTRTERHLLKQLIEKVTAEYESKRRRRK
ncbi:MAG: addiction module toxin RelE [Deltaproteobacteria bacterium]|nr:addiction module toxin RelE [Deltaproteobacteria bacterium]